MIRELLNIPRSGGTIVEDNRMKSDGCTEKDLANITVIGMQKVLDSTEDNFFTLWGELIENVKAKIEGKSVDAKILEETARCSEEERNAFVTAGVVLAGLRKMSASVQQLVYFELSKEFSKPATLEETKTTTHEQGKEGTDISGEKGNRKGGKKTEGIS